MSPNSHVAQSQQIQQSVSPCPSPCSNQSKTASLGVSPSKAVDIRGKCLTQLASLKQLFEDSVLTEEELKEQKDCILETLRKLT